jgi:hypothetical protein
MAQELERLGPQEFAAAINKASGNKYPENLSAGHHLQQCKWGWQH